MRTGSKNLLTSWLSLFTAFLVTTSWCRGEEPERFPHGADTRALYEKPTDPQINRALENVLAELTKAETELRSLQSEGKMVHPHKPARFNPFWSDYVKFTNGFFSAVFHSEKGPIRTFTKRMFADDKREQELYERGYEIQFDELGKVKSYSRRDGNQFIYFHSDGKPVVFKGDIDERTSGQASWTAHGKLREQKVSSHPVRGEKGLPEWERMLRDGNQSEKFDAEQAMVRIGPAAIPYALNVLQDGDEPSRESAAQVFRFLRERGVLAVPTLAQRLREDESPVVRRSIALVLGEMGRPAEAAIPALEQAAAEDVPEVAKAATAALERIRKPSVE
jgi:hypothetical protein